MVNLPVTVKFSAVLVLASVDLIVTDVKSL